MPKTKQPEYQVIFDVAGMAHHVVVFADNEEDAKVKGEAEVERRGWVSKLCVFKKAVLV